MTTKNSASSNPAAKATPNIDVRLTEECAQFINDPLGFVLWAFDWNYGELEGFDGPDTWQVEWLNNVGKAVAKNAFDGVTACMPVRMATASGHGIGKSALTAWVILWILCTRPHSKGIVTAGTGDQLRTKTWGELAKWKDRCILGHWWEVTSGKGSLSIYHRSFYSSWRADGLTCKEENSASFAGLHNATSTPFYIFDEASVVPASIWVVAEGGLTDGEPMFFVFGNPTSNTGTFKKCFNASSRWHNTRVDSRTAKMTNKVLIQEWLDDWGEDSDFFRVRVLGEFPKTGDTQFMGSDIVHTARKRTIGRYFPDDPLICGIDVARGGEDNTRIGFRRGKDAKSEKAYRITGEDSQDSMLVVSKISMLLNRHKPDITFVDETGIGGPIVDRLSQLGYNIVGINFGGKADDKQHFVNKTAEMGFRLRQWMMNGGAIPDDAQLEEELTARLFWHNAKDQLVLEPKGVTKNQDGMKKRLGMSPDWADQLYLTFALEVPKLDYERGMLDVAPDAREYINSKGNDYDPLDNI